MESGQWAAFGRANNENYNRSGGRNDYYPSCCDTVINNILINLSTFASFAMLHQYVLLFTAVLRDVWAWRKWIIWIKLVQYSSDNRLTKCIETNNIADKSDYLRS